MCANEQSGPDKAFIFTFGEKATASSHSRISRKNLFQTDTTIRLSDV